MPATITKEVKVDIVMPGKDVADLFWNLSSDEKAEFFNKLFDHGYSLIHNSFYDILRSDRLDRDGILVLNVIESLVKNYSDYLSQDQIK